MEKKTKKTMERKPLLKENLQFNKKPLFKPSQKKQPLQKKFRIEKYILFKFFFFKKKPVLFEKTQKPVKFFFFEILTLFEVMFFLEIKTFPKKKKKPEKKTCFEQKP